jgi:hypothetical protein
MQLDDWPLVEVALLLVGLAHISFGKTSFDPLGRDKSSFRLPIQFHLTGGYISTFLCLKSKNEDVMDLNGV